MSIVALDPGMTTGYAIMEDFGTYFVYQVDTRNVAEHYRTLNTIAPNQIVYENFKHRPAMMKVELHPVKIIGVTELFADLQDVRIAGMYLPAAAKAFWSEDKFKKLGLYKKGVPHGMDALRVLFKHLERTNMAWYQDMLLRLK